MPHYEEKKAIIAQRVKERKRAKAEAEAAPELEVEVLPPDEKPIAIVDEVLNDIVDAEFEEDLVEEDLELMSLRDMFQEVFEEAYQAYRTGVNFEDNPHAEEGMTEDEDDPNFVVSEVWSDGWLSAHTDACMANLVLLARKMVVSENNEEIVDIFDELSEAVEVLGEVLDYDNFENNWADIIE